MIDDNAEEMPDISNTVAGDDAVRMSRSGIVEKESSAIENPRIADRRLRINVLSVGRSNEYKKVDVEAFQTDDTPPVVQSCERTSKNADGFLILSMYWGLDD